jgi:hypothetical protein
VSAAGVVTGWGSGIAALPADATLAAGGRAVVAVPPGPATGERFRRATRECLLGVAAVEALRADAGLDRAMLAGPRTGLVYVTAAAYGASNRQFLDGDGGRALHFPYTAPCAVAAEVTIEFQLTGPYVTMVGGADTTRDALWHAGRLLGAEACDRVLVLALETFAECADLWARARWRCPPPLTEAAACVMLQPDVQGPAFDETVLEPFERLARRRAGETLACGPLIALALARDAALAGPLTVTTGD